MLAASYKLRALDPLWFRGLGPGGNGWDPSVIHATALNHALLVGLGFAQPHRVFNALWVPHSLPYRSVGLWMSPAEVVEGTARPMQIFKGGTSGEKLRVVLGADKSDAAAEKEARGTSVYQTHVTADGGFELVRGNPGKLGRPYLTTGYFGEWTGVLLAEDAQALAVFPGEGRVSESFVLRLGPNRVMVEVTLDPFVEVEAAAEDDGVYADHLSDPMLLPDDVEGVVQFARPAPLVRALANGTAGDLRVRTFPIFGEASA